MPTLLAYRDHGDPRPRVAESPTWAAATVPQLAALGIDLEDVSRQLEAEGLRKFVQPFDDLIARIDAVRAPIVAEGSGQRPQNTSEQTRP